MKAEKMRCTDGRHSRLNHDGGGNHNMTGIVLRAKTSDLMVVQAKLWMVDTNVLAFFMRREPGVASLIELVQGRTEKEAFAKAKPTIEKLLG